MKVLMATSELQPFAKAGGLGDVCSALARALTALGAEVAIALPLYPSVRRTMGRASLVADGVSCSFARENRPFRLLRTTLPGAPEAAVFLIENPGMFEAEEAYYGTAPGAYGDGRLRFLYFSRALLAVPRAAGFWPDVLHLNDWPTALVAPLLRTVHAPDARLAAAAVVLTVHNLAYQGVFPVEDLVHAGLPGFLLQDGRLLEKGRGNLLAGGLRFADALSTVSRTYAREILTAEFGEGLEALLQWRKDRLVGIQNGLDTETWNPASDPNLPAHYDATDLGGKAVCRRTLLQQSGLEPTAGPVFGLVARLAGQKGLELAAAVMERVLAAEPSARLVVLGQGEPALEDAFLRLAAGFGRRAHARLAFDPPFASLVEAGSDLFLMPSRFEPCGLNQLISMRYGTPPIVRRVGGLADTVVDATDEAVRAGRATGFTFDAYSTAALEDAILRAIALFRRPADFARLRRAGMTADWTWTQPAREYLALYDQARRSRREGSHLHPLLSDLPKEPLEVVLPPLAPIPDGYPRDCLALIPFDPTTLFCLWELGGHDSQRLFDALSPPEKKAITYDLVVTDGGTGHQHRLAVGGLSRQWFVAVEPGRRYRAELFLNVPGQPPRRVLDHPEVAMPPAVWPEAR